MINACAHKNLKLLWWLRCIAIAGQTTAILAVTCALGIPLRTAPLWSIIGALAAVNIGTLWRIRTAQRICEGELFAQLLVDMTALLGLLYFTGGAANPFASLFILQVIIAAIALSPRYTWSAAAVTVGFYTLLMFKNVEMPYFEHHHTGNFFTLHVQGMWISFVLLAIIVAGFVVRMNGTIRRQDALLAEAEKIAAIGALAANAAHELGTPLATLTILAEDAGELSPLFKEQLARCKQIVSRITAKGGVIRAESGAPMMLDAFLRRVAEGWQADNPDTVLTATIAASPAQRIIAEHGLEQAIRNLLDNAADASPPAVALHAAWTAQTLTVTITDTGNGIAPHIAEAIGKAGITTKPHGMGMGLLLAHSVVARLEGTLAFMPAPRGTIARIALPLRKLAL
jgi:two-component system sensor histidine kinase RegB